MLIPASILKSYKRALGQYHLRPESKFGNGDYFDRGITGRKRHVKALGIRNIGKESNRWEERYHLGPDESAQIDYGSGFLWPKPLIEAMIAEITRVGQRKVARQTGIARRTIERFVRGQNVRQRTFRCALPVSLSFTMLNARMQDRLNAPCYAEVSSLTPS